LRVEGRGLRVAGVGTYPDRFAVRRVQEPGFGFRVRGSAFGSGGPVSGFGSRFLRTWFRVPGFGFRVLGFGFRISGFGFLDSGSGFRV